MAGKELARAFREPWGAGGAGGSGESNSASLLPNGARKGTCHHGAMLVLALVWVTLTRVQADLLDIWTWRNPLPSGNSLYEVENLNGRLVAVGDLATIVTSTNGISWTKCDTGTNTAPLSSVAYGNGVFVAAGGRVFNSRDGIQWARNPTVAGIGSLTYGNGIFVGIGGTGLDPAFVTSVDGTNWASHFRSHQVYHITYGNSRFVAVGGNWPSSGVIVTSTNGTNWSQIGGSLPATLTGVAYGNGIFVAVGASGKVLTSPNGTTWTQQPSGTVNDLHGISYGNGQFLTQGLGGGTLSSPDGINWTPRSFGSSLPSFNSRGMCGWNGNFVVVGLPPEGMILTSPNLTTWFRRTVGPTPWMIQQVAYGAGRYVGVTENRTFVTSTNGLTWTSLFVPDGNGIACVTYASNKFVAAGTAMLTSSNGTAWTLHESAPIYGGAIVHGNGMFVVAGGSDPALIGSSRNGTNWTWNEFGPSGIYDHFMLNSVAFAKGRFVAVGGNGTFVYGSGVVGPSSVLTSTNGTNWSRLDDVTPCQLVGVAFGNNQFVAIDSCGSVIISSDGIGWSLPSSDRLDPGTSVGGGSITYGAGQFLALWSGGLFASPDGLNWTRHTFGARDILEVNYINGSFWAVGYNGAILECNTRTRLSAPQPLPNRSVQFTVTGLTGQTNAIQASTDLTHWTTLTNLTLTNETAQYFDLSASNFSSRYYRAIFR